MGHETTCYLAVKVEEEHHHDIELSHRNWRRRGRGGEEDSSSSRLPLKEPLFTYRATRGSMAELEWILSVFLDLSSAPLLLRRRLLHLGLIRMTTLIRVIKSV